MSTQKRMKSVLSEVLSKLETADLLRKYLVNRDLAIEIDGQRFQITKRKPTDEEKELELLRTQRINLKRAMKELINTVECLHAKPEIMDAIKAASDARKVLVDN